MRRAALLLPLLLGCGASAAPPAAHAEGSPGPWAEHPEVLRLPVPLDASPGRGAERPLVTIIVFSDFQCPFCRQAVPVLERAQAAHPDQIRVHFRHLPLPMHEHAVLAAEASEEARAQGGENAFWSFHDRLFATDALDLESLVGIASELGLDAERFRVAMRGRVHRARVEGDVELAEAIGLDGTPVFFVNGRPILGVPDEGDLETMLGQEIALANEALSRGIPQQDLYERLLADATATLLARMREERAEREPERELDLTRVYAVPADGAASLGPATAPVTIVVFSDFQCPFCSRAVPIIGALLERHPNEIRVVFRHNPLGFHRYAADAARAAEEARAQRGDAAFWQMHDRLFANQDALGREDLVRHAEALGLDAARMAQALESGAHQETLDRDREIAVRFGAVSTPMFYLNGRLVQGAQPFEVFEAVFEEARQRALATGATGDGVYAAVVADGATEAVWVEPLPQR